MADEFLDVSGTDVVDVSAEERDLIDVGTSFSSSLNPQAINRRATMAAHVLGNETRPEAISDEISQGNETRVRDRVGAQARAAFEQDKFQAIKGFGTEDITQETVDRAASLSTTSFVSDADNAIEKAFGYKVAKDTLAKNHLDLPEDVKLKASAEVGDEIAFDRYLDTVREDLEAKHGQGLGPITDNLKQFVPLLSWYNTRNSVTGSSATSLLGGSNIQEQIEYLYLLPPDKRMQELNTAVADIASRNPLDALHFLDAVKSYSQSDQALQNLFTGLDATIIPGAAKSAVALGKAGVRAALGRGSQKSLAETAIAAAKESRNAPGSVKALADGGQLDLAAEQQAHRNVVELINKRDPLEDTQGIQENLQQLFNPAGIASDPGSLTQERVNRLTAKGYQNARLLADTVATDPRVQRIPVESVQVGVRQAKEELKKRWGHLSDAQLASSFRVIKAEETPSNTTTVLMRLGKQDSIKAARESAEVAAEATTDDAQLLNAVRDRLGKKIGTTGTGFEQGKRYLDEVSWEEAHADIPEKYRPTRFRAFIDKGKGQWHPAYSNSNLEDALQETIGRATRSGTRHILVDYATGVTKSISEKGKVLREWKTPPQKILEAQKQAIKDTRDLLGLPETPPGQKGFYAPSGTPKLDPEIVKFVRLLESVVDTHGQMLLRDVYERLAATGKLPKGYVGPEGYGEFRKMAQRAFDAERTDPGTGLRMTRHWDDYPAQAEALKGRTPDTIRNATPVSGAPRDEGYGLETLRNRLIDSELTIDAGSAQRSSSFAHYVLGRKASPKMPGKPPVATPEPARITTLEHMSQAIDRMLDGLPKRAEFGFGTDKRPATLNTSPYPNPVEKAFEIEGKTNKELHRKLRVLQAKVDRTEGPIPGHFIAEFKKLVTEFNNKRPVPERLSVVFSSQGPVTLPKSPEALLEALSKLTRRAEGNPELQGRIRAFVSETEDAFMPQRGQELSPGMRKVLFKEKLGKYEEFQRELSPEKPTRSSSKPKPPASTTRKELIEEAETTTSEVAKKSIPAARRLSKKTQQIVSDKEIVKGSPKAIAKAAAELRQEAEAAQKIADDAVAAADPTPIAAPSVPHVEGKTLQDVALGKSDATLFTSRDEAAHWGHEVYGLSPDQFRVLKAGRGGYYIAIPMEVNETTAAVRDTLLQTDNVSKQSLVNTFFGFLRGHNPRNAADVISPFQFNNRLLATMVPNQLRGALKETAQSIIALPKSELKELKDILVINRDTERKLADGSYKRGQIFKTIGEVEQAWLKQFDKLPSDGQIQAYFDYARLNEVDYWLRATTLHRALSTRGIETVTITKQFGEKEKDIRPFYGVVQDKIPFDTMSNHTGIAFIHDKGVEVRLIEDSDKYFRERVSDAVRSKEYRVVKVANPLEKPLLGVTGNNEAVHYVVTKDFHARPIRVSEVLPYNDGGHVQYSDEFFVKQPMVRQTKNANSYEGDVSIASAATEKQAREFSQRMERARTMLLGGVKDDTLHRYLRKNLPFTIDEFKAMFEHTVEDAATGIRRVASSEADFADKTLRPPRLHKETPITWTQSGKNSFDMAHNARLPDRYKNFRNLVRDDDNLMQQVGKEFIGAKDPDLDRIVEGGTFTKPMVTLGQPDLVCPLKTIEYSLANSVRGRYTEDYLQSAYESFIQEFHPVLDTPLNELRQNPQWHTLNPTYKERTDNKDLLAMAQTVQKRIRMAAGAKSEIVSTVDYLQRKILNNVYPLAGQKAGDWVMMHMLPSERDPVQFMRGMAFHVNFFMSPAQLFVQGQQAAHAIAIAGPVQGLKSAVNSTLLASAAVNPSQDVLMALAKRAESLGTHKSAAHFIESWNEMKRSGFFQIGHEVAIRNEISNPSLFTSKFGQVLDFGNGLFNKGERFGRLTAWDAAFSEWRKANPNKIITDSARSQIYQRAHLMYGDMTNASKATWERGILSVPTQFWTFQVRLMEQMLGSRLTNSEKMRVATTYSLLYGLPAGAIASMTGIPAADSLRQAALERGINLSDNYITQVLTEGVPSAILSMATGGHYNVSERYGPGGLPLVGNLFSVFTGVPSDDKTTAEILTGASGQTLLNIAHPMAKAIRSLFNPEADPPALSDFHEILNNVSVYRYTSRAVAAYNTGRYYSRKGRVVAEGLTPTDAALMGMFDLTPREVTDAFKIMKSNSERVEYQKPFRQEFNKYVHMGFEAYAKGDPELGDKYWKKAQAQVIAGGFNETEWASLWHGAIKNNGTLAESAEATFIKRAPSAEMQDRMNMILHRKESR